jgi:hypothetical protein
VHVVLLYCFLSACCTAAGCWQIHADAVMTYPQLTAAAQRLRRHLRHNWRRLDGLMQEVRCMTDFLSNAQQV